MTRFSESLRSAIKSGWTQAQTPGSRGIIVFDESAQRIRKTGGIAHSDFA